MFVASADVRAPVVVNDRFLQQIFTANMPGGRIAPKSNNDALVPRTITGFISYIINVVFQYCYSTISNVLNYLLGRNQDRSKLMSNKKNKKTKTKKYFLLLVSAAVVTDPLGDVMKFIHSYNEQYPQHPVFYQGTYAQALNDAKQELRFLLVYLHQNPQNNCDVDSFCRDTLSNPSVIEFINRNTLFWGCDISSPEGYRISQSINARSYPIMVLIALRTNRMVIMGRYEGDCTADELIRRLQAVINSNDIWLSQARADRMERNLTQTLRQQQDEAYRESLIADEEKERRRQMERQKEREAQEALERERAEAEKRKEVKNCILRSTIHYILHFSNMTTIFRRLKG